MQIGKINYNQFSKISVTSFKGDNKPSEPAKNTITPTVKETDKFVKSEPKTAEKPKSSITKKIAVGCVGLCPGFGQFVNGQWLKAIGFAIGVPLASTAGFFIGGYVGLAIAGGTYLWNVIDAIKNA